MAKSFIADTPESPISTPTQSSEADGNASKGNGRQKMTGEGATKMRRRGNNAPKTPAPDDIINHHAPVNSTTTLQMRAGKCLGPPMRLTPPSFVVRARKFLVLATTILVLSVGLGFLIRSANLFTQTELQELRRLNLMSFGESLFRRDTVQRRLQEIKESARIASRRLTEDRQRERDWALAQSAEGANKWGEFAYRVADAVETLLHHGKREFKKKQQQIQWRLQRLPTWIPFWRVASPTGVVDPRLPSVEQLQEDAKIMLDWAEVLKSHKFFRIFKIDLMQECPFWARREICTDPGACSVCECDEDEVPREWKLRPVRNFVDRETFGAVRPWGADTQEGPYGVDGQGGALVDSNVHDQPDSEQEESDSFLDDAANFGMSERPNAAGSLFLSPLGFPTISDEDSSTATYVDLSLNRPGYTGYGGRNIWGLIYNENCMGHKSNPFESLIPDQKYCTEEEIYYRIISGMQTLIMTLSAAYNRPKMPPLEYVERLQELKKAHNGLSAQEYRSLLQPDLKLFKDRVAPVSQWIENMHVAFGVLMNTLCNLKNILKAVDCHTGDVQDDIRAQQDLRNLLDIDFHSCKVTEAKWRRKRLRKLRQLTEAISNVTMNQGVEGIALASECKKIRELEQEKERNAEYDREAEEEERHPFLFERKQELAMRQFANVSRIMDCLECEKCRLHGKVKIVALQLALRSSGNVSVKTIERNEIIALINALDYFADGIVSFLQFRRQLYILRAVWAAALLSLVGCVFCGIKWRRRRRKMVALAASEKKRA